MENEKDVPISIKVGKNLKRYIKESRFITQDKFATEGMNVDPVTVRRWIAHGVKDINTIEKIAVVLGVEIDKLIE